MAEILSPGVYIEEVASNNNVISGVSTSNLGTAGFTPRGPTDVATLVTSYAQFGRIFGADNKNSLAVKSIQAFYANGGRRAFFVRVMPSNSVKADGRIQSTTYNTVIETGTGAATTYSKTSATSVLKDNLGTTPIVPGSFTAKFRGTGDTLTADAARARDGITALIGSITSTKYEGRIDPYKHLMVGTSTAAIYFRGLLPGSGSAVRIAFVSGLAESVAVAGNDITITYNAAVSTATTLAATVNGTPAAAALVTATAQLGGAGIVIAVQALTLLAGIPVLDTELDVVTSGTGGVDVVVGWTDSVGAKSLTFPAASAGPVVTATSGNISGSFDRRSGFFSIAADPLLVLTTAAFTVTGVAASDTNTVLSGTTVDVTGKTLLTGAALSGTGITVNYVNVADGSYSVDLSAATKFHKNGKMVVSYKINAWNIRPISNGVWGNGVRVDIYGNANYFTASTGQYSRFNVNVLVQDTTTLLYSVAEAYEELVFNDSTSAVYFPDVLNELSDLVVVVEPGADEAPGELGAVTHSYVLGGGDDSSVGKAFTVVLPNATIAKRSVVITYTSATDNLSKTINDDGAGLMVTDVDSSGTNTIVYSSGAVSFSTVHPVKVGTLVSVTYATAAAETLHSEKLGDTTKLRTYTLTVGGLQSFYTAGTDGTFTSSTYSRTQFTDPALITGYTGLYALSRVDELMQVILPDFTSVGDIAVIGDLLDYAAARANSPSGGDRFIILTTPRGSSPQEAVDWFRYTLGRYSKFAALYWPWVTVADSLSNGRNLTVPPLGHVAGVYARTDANRNVGKSPGGTVDGALLGLTGLEYISTLGERDFVYPNKINPLISSAQTGLAVWGVRTIAIESEWRYVNARRLFMFVEKSVFNATHWVVFENNGPALWAKIKSQLNGFLTGLFNEGYFAGNSPSQAFYVTCDETNNPQSSIDAGQVIIDVGLAPNKPAEFVRFRFQQVSL